MNQTDLLQSEVKRTWRVFDIIWNVQIDGLAVLVELGRHGAGLSRFVELFLSPPLLSRIPRRLCVAHL